MTKRKRTALEALDAFEREQEDRTRRAAELRRAAALELGVIVMEEGGARLKIEALRAAVKAAVAALATGHAAVHGSEARRG